MTSCQVESGSWLVMRVEPAPYRSFDDFHQIAALAGCEAVGAPIVEDQQLRRKRPVCPA